MAELLEVVKGTREAFYVYDTQGIRYQRYYGGQGLSIETTSRLPAEQFALLVIGPGWLGLTLRTPPK